MPVYTYRREDGTTFDIRQKFSDDPLETDPETGQAVQRVIQPAGIVFKGSGFYVNDSKGKKTTAQNGTQNGTEAKSKDDTSTDTKASSDTSETSSSKPETKSETSQNSKAS